MRRQETADRWWSRWPVWQPSVASSSPGSRRTTAWLAAAGSSAEPQTEGRGSGDKVRFKGKKVLNKETKQKRFPQNQLGPRVFLMFILLFCLCFTFIFFSSLFLAYWSLFFHFSPIRVSVFSVCFGWKTDAHALPGRFRSPTLPCQSDHAQTPGEHLALPAFFHTSLFLYTCVWIIVMNNWSDHVVFARFVPEAQKRARRSRGSWLRQRRSSVLDLDWGGTIGGRFVKNKRI